VEPDEFSAIDAVIARAVADAYDKGRALGYAEGYDAGFLVMAKAGVGITEEVAADDCESRSETAK